MVFEDQKSYLRKPETYVGFADTSPKPKVTFLSFLKLGVCTYRAPSLDLPYLKRQNS